MYLKKQAVSLVLVFTVLTGAVGVVNADFKDGLYFYYKEDYAAAFAEWRVLATEGHADSQYNLGLMYAQGEAVAKNNKKAVNWLELASKQGHIKADEELERLYCVMGKRKLIGLVGGMQSVLCR